MLDQKQITDDLRGTYRGRLHFDRLTRGQYATDASAFQVEPLAVAVPEDEESLAALVRYCHSHAVPIIPRGGGTGLAGESLGPAIILDLSVHFRRIIRIDRDIAIVQPGVVLHQLNAELTKVGRRFVLNPASAATCTLGGMIATNASGSNAFRYGYTRDYVAALGVMWDTGHSSMVPGTADSSQTGANEEITNNDQEQRTNDEGSKIDEGNARREIISHAVMELLNKNKERIAVTRARTAFDRCGYQLHGILGSSSVDLAKLLVGSEGTLAIITQAAVRTIPVAGGTCEMLLGFPTLEAAVRAGLALRRLGPVSCDLLDRRLLSVTRNAALPSVGAALLATFEADSEREASERGWGAMEALRREHVLRVLAEPTCEPAEAARIRGVRDAAVSGLYAAGGPRPLPFVEDVGVPADALPEFLVSVQDILKRFEMSGTFLAHVLTGQVHTRPLIDLNESADREKLWPLAEAVHGLALSLGGTVSTQHGTGIARTPWVERQCGPLVPIYRELKRIFDPKGILNPGKIVGPDPSREAWPLRAVGSGQWAVGSEITEKRDQTTEEGESREPQARGPAASLLLWNGVSPAQEVARCNGCGDCRTRTLPERMCPTFRATGDEAATPRGMTNMLRVLTNPETATPEELRAAAELCVNCKQCRDECPAKVNVPKLMLETKARHHAEHGLDRSDWFLARAEGLAMLGSNFAPLVNLMMARRPVRWLLEKFFGIARQRRLPAFTLRNFYRRARRLGLTKKRGISESESQVRNPQSGIRNDKVALFIDVFPAYNDPLIGMATVAVLQHNGIEVYVPRRQVGSGAAPYAKGDLDAARDAAVRNVRLLTDLAREGYRIVCPEPTAALMLSQDYLDILDDPDAAAVAANTVELTSYLSELHAAGKLRTDFHPLDLSLGHHIPCHQKALRTGVRSPELLSLIPGVRVHVIDAGCSGMAGTWGLKAEHYATSLAAGARMIAELDRPRVLFGSTECSACRMQMEEGSGKRTLHPVQYLAYAYGLMPEIEAKLRRPLGRLVSD